MGAKGVTPAGIAQTLDATIGATATVAAYGVPAESNPRSGHQPLCKKC